MIYALLSVDNNYDQPPNNLVAWWKNKPELAVVASTLDMKFPSETDEQTLTVVNIWSGKEVKIGETHYRLKQLKEGLL